MGKMTLANSEIQFSKSKTRIPVSESTTIKVKYAGDKHWKSNFKPLMWYKQLCRYDHLWYTSNQIDLYDYLEVNGQRVYVKIYNETDKQAFLKFVERLEQLSVKLI